MKEVYLCITDKCNLKCDMCFYNKSNKVLKKENILNNLLRMSEKDRVIIFGGEPMLEINTVNFILNICKDLKLLPVIVTNCTIYDDILNDKYLGIQVSLYKNEIDRQISVLKKITNPNITVHITVNNENIKDYDFFNKALNTGYKTWVNIEFFRTVNTYDINSWFDFISKNCDNEKLKDIFLLNDKTRPGRECLKYEGKSYRVYADGTVGLCSFSKTNHNSQRISCDQCDNVICRVCKCDIFSNELVESQCYFYKKAQELLIKRGCLR